MKAPALILLFAICSVECRKVVAPINKHANIDFINMESGGARLQPAVPPNKAPAAPPVVTGAPAPVPTTKSPAPAPAAKPAQQPTPKPATPQPTPKPTQIKPVPVNPAPVVNPITTPGPGSVKSLVNFYNSQGTASAIRPYSYSQAVKQG